MKTQTGRRLAAAIGLAALALVAALAHAEVLEIPTPGTTHSGIGAISGWTCDPTGDLTIRFDGGDPIPLLYGSLRPDVLDAERVPMRRSVLSPSGIGEISATGNTSQSRMMTVRSLPEVLLRWRRSVRCS